MPAVISFLDAFGDHQPTAITSRATAARAPPHSQQPGPPISPDLPRGGASRFEWHGWARLFAIFGTNAIVAFFGSPLLAKIALLTKWTEPNGDTVSLQGWLYSHSFGAWLPDYVASLAWALTYVVIWLGLMTVLYRRRIFIKI